MTRPQRDWFGRIAQGWLLVEDSGCKRSPSSADIDRADHCERARTVSRASEAEADRKEVRAWTTEAKG